MDELQRSAHVLRNGERACEGQRLPIAVGRRGGHHVGDGAPGHVLLDDVRLPGLLADIVHRDEVRVPAEPPIDCASRATRSRPVASSPSVRTSASATSRSSRVSRTRKTRFVLPPVAQVPPHLVAVAREALGVG